MAPASILGLVPGSVFLSGGEKDGPACSILSQFLMYSERGFAFPQAIVYTVRIAKFENLRSL